MDVDDDVMMCFFSFIVRFFSRPLDSNLEFFQLSSNLNSESLSLLDHFLFIASLTIVVSFKLGQ